MTKNHQFTIRNAKRYCCEPIENIEGYAEMMASDEWWDNNCGQ